MRVLTVVNNNPLS